MTAIATAMATTGRPQKLRSALMQSSATVTTSTTMRTTGFTLQLMLLSLAIVATTVEASNRDNEEYYNARRAASKPWLMKEFQLLEFPDTIYDQIVGLIDSMVGSEAASLIPRTIFVSPFTIIVVTLAVANVWSWLSYHLSGTWVEANHILIKDVSPKTLKALVGLKDQLGKDAKLFGLTAKQYSQCPSAEQNGDLGRFGPGVMAPPFDRLCFDPSTPVNETIGPVQTQFGYHLIYLRKRKF